MNSEIIQKIASIANTLDKYGYGDEADYLTKIAHEIVTEDLGNPGENPDLMEIGEHAYLLHRHGSFIIELEELLFTIAENLGVEIVGYGNDPSFNSGDLNSLVDLVRVIKNIVENEEHPRESGAISALKAMADCRVFKYTLKAIKGFSVSNSNRTNIRLAADDFIRIVNMKLAEF